MQIKELFCSFVFEIIKEMYQKDDIELKEIIINDNEDIFIDFLSNKNISSKDFLQIETEINKKLQENSNIQHIKFKILNISEVKKDSVFCQRLTLCCFEKEEDLKIYCDELQQKIANDHRNLNDKLNFFCQIPISKGNVLFLKNGALLFNRIIRYLENQYEKNDYYIVKTPIIFQSQMWEKTGHMDKYKDNIFITEEGEIIKPMNCPAHMEIFNHLSLSYKQLPLRIGEIGYVHRKEDVGGLQGLKRCRGFHIDDGHIFLEIEDIPKELKLFFEMLNTIYGDFGFNSYEVYLTTRPEESIGDDVLWEKAENLLQEYLENANIPYILEKGDGAFYGPKLEIRITKKFTLGTIQIDFFLPKKLDITYINPQNTPTYPIVLHRAVLGSLERFIGFLIEYYEGNLPIWLSPITVSIISLENSSYSQKVIDKLKKNNIRINVNNSEEHMNNKIKKALQDKIPYIIIIGNKEATNNTITLRLKDKNIILTIEDFIQKYIIDENYYR
ncbi:threonine--tRNA ligase [Rickettsiales bacterium (ex Bugula neritina AB1)]|nr:threonine--tRNA ligase [Rickettsiales bacterium (ex Bugula neritina AB1)]